MQCSGKRGLEAMVHSGKVTYNQSKNNCDCESVFDFIKANTISITNTQNRNM